MNIQHDEKRWESLQPFLKDRTPEPRRVEPRSSGLGETIWRILPWGLSLGLISAMVVSALWAQPETVLEQNTGKREALTRMHSALAAISSAEQNALLSVELSEAHRYADQAREASQQFETARKHLARLILLDQRPEEQRKLIAFDSSWNQYRNLESTLLNLATQQSNVQARRLSAERSLPQIDRLAAALPARPQAQAVLIAVLRLQALQAPHIEASSDAQMDRLEAAMQNLEQQAHRHLAELGNPGPASQALAEFLKVHHEILRLSRQNTNVKSVALSLGKKQLLTSECQARLAELDRAVQDFKATR